MGRRGPRPKPTALRVLEGNPGKRALPAREPKPTRVSYTPMPRFLGVVAREEWRRVARQLEILGLLTNLDLAALEVYCDTYGRWRAARKARDWRTIREAAALMRQYAAEFGLTPAARVRIETDEPPALPKSGTEGHAARFFRD